MSSGTYKLYLLWYDALKLNLRANWMEPAHVFKGSLTAGIRAGSLPTAAKVRPEVMQPAHFRVENREDLARLQRTLLERI